jgi:exoribonuclease R
VPAFVDPSGAVAAEAFRRGQTLYAPDTKAPLHPPSLSEDAASLLPDVDRPAFVWRFDLDDVGEVQRTELVRGLVRSRLRLDYRTVQDAADAGHPSAGDGLLGTQAGLLAEVGRARIERERARGGASLPMPEQDVVADDGRFALVVRPPLAAEEWNAQISLMTGMAAARIMLDGGVGLLRTMPPPDEERVRAFRAQSERLGVPWPPGMPYGEFVRALDAAQPAQLALIHAAAGLFRGSGYTPVSELGAEDAKDGTHAAVAAPYAHVTAPLRRLVDRFALVCSYHLSRGEPVPGWAGDALAALPERMRATDQLAGDLERACLDAVEAAVLDGRVGETFDAVVVDVRKEGARGSVQLFDPPVLSRSDGPLELGARLRVRLVTCDPERGEVAFEPAGAGEANGSEGNSSEGNGH